MSIPREIPPLSNPSAGPSDPNRTIQKLLTQDSSNAHTVDPSQSYSWEVKRPAVSGSGKLEYFTKTAKQLCHLCN